MDQIKQAIQVADRPAPVNSVQLRKALDIMFPHSYIKSYHQPPNSVCSIFCIKTTFIGEDTISSSKQEHGGGGNCSNEHLKYEASSEPSSRSQVIRLQNQFQNSLVEHQAKAVGLCPIRRAIYDQCFDELIRQVTVGCIEQGLLLFQVRNELRLTIVLYRRAYESAIGYGLGKALEAGLELEESRVKLKAALAQSASVSGCGDDDLIHETKTAQATLTNDIDQAERLKEYYESELANRDEIIVQQRSVIKALTQK